MKKPNASTRAAVASVIDYNVMTQAIANAALSRRAALQIEVAVSLIHFTQESGGTDTIGKAALKSVYNDAGYICLAKADRDYKTVNRRLNAMSKLFDKLGSSLVYSWMADKGDTEAIINHVVTEVAVFGFDTMDDVLAYVGAETNKTRAARQPKNGPVNETKAPEQEEEEEEGQAPARLVQSDMDVLYAALVNGLGPEELRQFCTRILTHVAAVELAQEQQQEQPLPLAA